jgi:hypothetical protein
MYHWHDHIVFAYDENIFNESLTFVIVCHIRVLKNCILTVGKGKGKVHPRTGHEGPEGEKMYSSTLSLTSVLDGGGWSTPHSGHFTPGNDPVPIVQEAG